MSPKIRPYRRSDARNLMRLIRALARYEKLRPPTPAAARRLLGDVGRRIKVLMAECEGRAVGYAIYFFTYSTFLGRPTLYLEDIFVLPDQRRLGIGALLFDALLREARRKRCGRMEWQVLRWNRPAHRFYEKYGAARLEEWVGYRLKP
jgi:GNAT superfamily N-acetyltransferase